MKIPSFNDLPRGFSFPPSRRDEVSQRQRYRVRVELHELELVMRPGGKGRKARLLATIAEADHDPFRLGPRHLRDLGEARHSRGG